jgi:hypothetical protein
MPVPVPVLCKTSQNIAENEVKGSKSSSGSRKFCGRTSFSAVPRFYPCAEYHKYSSSEVPSPNGYNVDEV